jgi:soluble cytochrome b562
MGEKSGADLLFFTGVKRKQRKQEASQEFQDFVAAFERFKVATDERLKHLERCALQKGQSHE